MLALYPLISVLFCILGLAEAKSSTGNDVLVILDPTAEDKYSIFFDDLRGKHKETITILKILKEEQSRDMILSSGGQRTKSLY